MSCEPTATGTPVAAPGRRSARTLAAVLVLAFVWVAVPRAQLGLATHVASEIASETPYLFGLRDETYVRVTLRNDGMETWDPELEFNLSYRWFRGWKSRTATPLDTEGVRTSLPHVVAPGETVTIEARLERPEIAGPYFLQWDIVHEGVTWFSDRAYAPPPRHRVLVLPRTSTLLAALSVALALWLPLGRRTWPVAAVVAWCAVSLLVKQLLAVEETAGDLAPSGVPLTVMLSVGPPLIVAVLVTSRIRPLLLWTLAAAGAIVALADLLYFRYFGDLMSLPALRAFGQTGQLAESGADLIALRDLWLVADLIVALPFVVHRPRAAAPDLRLAPALRAATVATVIAVTALASWTSPWVTRQVFTRVRVARQIGLFGYHAVDAWAHSRAAWLRAPLPGAERDDIRAWFDDRAPLRAGTGPHFGVAAGMNVIVVQVESLQAFVIGLELDGEPITPNLNRWWDEGVAFSAITDQTGEGRTSDAEFSALTSLLPLDEGAVAFRYPGNGFVSWASVLRDRGYTTLAAIPFAGAFWNRSITLPSYGFSHTMFDDAFKPGPVVGWGLNDRDFMGQVVPALAQLPKPFMAWLITLSNHHPYVGFPPEFQTLDVGGWAGTPFGGYLHGMRHLDAALGDLREGLERAGLADNTVIAIFGDHDAGFPWDNRIARAVGFPTSPAGWLLEDRVPWLILVPGDEVPPGPRDTPGGLIDMGPTMLGLLGVDAAPLPFMGRNLLGLDANDVRVRPHGGWRNAQYMFHAASGRCLSVARRREVSPARCEPASDEAAHARAVGTRVITHGLQSQLLPDTADVQ